MTANPETARGQLEALRRFFLFRYAEEVRRHYPAFYNSFPLSAGTRVDLVQVNGGERAHFVWQRGSDGEHLVVIHDLTISGAGVGADHEQGFVRRALELADPMAHYVLQPPFDHCYDEVEQEAVDAVARHAKIRPRR